MASKRNSEKQVIASSGAAAVPVRRKSVTTKRTPHTAAEISSIPVSQPEILALAIPAPVTLAAPPAESRRDVIARLAYSYWEARGYQGGSPEADWLRAEQEISAK